MLLFVRLLLAELAVPMGALLWRVVEQGIQIGVLSVLTGNRLHIWFPATVLNMPFNFSAQFAISIIYKYKNKYNNIKYTKKYFCIFLIWFLYPFQKCAW